MEETEDLTRPGTPRPTTRYRMRLKASPTTYKRAPEEPTGATPPAKSTRVEDDDMRTMMVEEDDSVVLMIEDFWSRTSKTELRAAQWKEFEKLILFDTFERTAKVDAKIDLRWVKTVGDGGELKARLCVRGWSRTSRARIPTHRRRCRPT